MRILHVDTGREVRGGQIQMMLTVKGLREAGCECAVLASGAANVSSVWSHSRHCDLLHAHDARAHTLAAVASRCPFVVSRRVAFPVKRSLASRWKYSRARRYIAVSRFVARQVEAAGVSASKIDVVYDGVEPQSLAVWSPRNPAVALASADPLKGRTLIERAAHIATVPVRFTSDLATDLEDASMFVYISESEGLGSAALLAMAKGVPVVASSVGGLAELLDCDPPAGLAVRNDPEEIARWMKMVRDDPALAATLIKGGLARVQSGFTMQHLISGTTRSYETALAGEKAFAG